VCKGIIIFLKGNLRFDHFCPERLLHFGILYRRTTLHKTLSPKAIFVKNRDDCVAQMSAVIEVNSAIHGGGVALPNSAILAAVKKLNQQGARF
jgi:hypothetical protein